MVQTEDRTGRECLDVIPHGEFMRPSEFCDSGNSKISTAVRNILKGCRNNEGDIATRLFFWVRDNVKYKLGLHADRASETLLKAEGSCSNKANLLVALLRAVELPAGFHILEVKTKEYFGPLSIRRINQFISSKSLHVHSAIYLHDKWVSVDASDDIRLSQSVRHLSPQATPVDFHGTRDALLHLDPAHIISKSEFPLPSIDHIFRKTSKLPTEMLRILDIYADYLRQNCILFDSIEEMEAAFFEWLQIVRPIDHQIFTAFEEQLMKAQLTHAPG